MSDVSVTSGGEPWDSAPWWPRLSALGSALAVVLFLGTLRLPVHHARRGGHHAGPIPVLGAQPGQFLLKDPVLIGVALWALGEALGAQRNRVRQCQSQTDMSLGG
ncbi:hypothetical protein [Mycobacterium sp. DL99]|uniref:hypothetical protein n=1 Tax=Mycobacterium sp. DL99 TaxID=2528957 RepID=UPI001AEC47D6|nr:hypothetical protein [Mycobacterium sp. DL99]